MPHATMARRQAPGAPTHAFVVLLRAQEDAARVAALLGEIGLADAVVAVPPVRGLAFFADPSPEVDEWWGETIPRDVEPVYLLGDEPGILVWTKSVDGLFVVGVDEAADTAAYAGYPRVRAVIVTDAVDFVITVAREFGGLAASMDAASLLGQAVPRRTSSPQPRASRFRRARLDAATELLVEVPNTTRPVAPRQLLVTVDDESDARGSEAFFTPTTARPTVVRNPSHEGDPAAVAS